RRADCNCSHRLTYNLVEAQLMLSRCVYAAQYANAAWTRRLSSEGPAKESCGRILIHSYPTMRTWIIVIIILAALALTGLGFASFSSGVPVEAAKVTRAPIREYIDEEAKTHLADEYLITMPYTGRIEAIDLVEGTKVSKGQVVARIVE